MNLEITKTEQKTQQYKMVPMEPKTTIEYTYWIDRKKFDTEEKAEKYKRQLLKTRTSINYREINKELEPFLSQYYSHDSYPEEEFWCKINTHDEIKLIKDYIIERHPLTKISTAFNFLREGWNYIAFLDWDDGDYDKREESWELIIKNKEEIINDLYRIEELLYKDLKD